MDLATAQLLMRLDLRVGEIHSTQKELKEEMATVREVLQQMSASVGSLDEDVTRVLAENQRLLERIASADVPLPADVQSEVDAMLAKMQTMNAAMDTQVPVDSQPETGNTAPEPAPVENPPTQAESDQSQPQPSGDRPVL